MSFIAPAEVAAFTELFTRSEWDRVEVTIGDWELRLARATVEVPGFASPVAIEVGAVDVTRCVPIVAPHLATVRHSPCGASPYVGLGVRIDAATHVCDLEVMRMRSPLRAGIDGILRRICVADGALIQAGQTLFFVETIG